MAKKIETMENDKKQYIVITFGNRAVRNRRGYVDNIVRMQKITEFQKHSRILKALSICVEKLFRL